MAADKKLLGIGLLGVMAYYTMSSQEDVPPPPQGYPSGAGYPPQGYPYGGGYPNRYPPQGRWGGVPNYRPSWGDPMMNPQDKPSSRPPAPLDAMPDYSPAPKNTLQIYKKLGYLPFETLKSPMTVFAGRSNLVVDEGALRWQRIRDYYKKNPRFLTDEIGTNSISSSNFVELVEKGNPATFYMPYSLDEANQMTAFQSGRIGIKIDTWASFRYLANLMLLTMLNAGTKQEQNFVHLVKFFNYHDFWLDERGEVYQGIFAQLMNYLCQVDDRIKSIHSSWKREAYPPIFGDAFHPSTEQCDPYLKDVKDRIHKILYNNTKCLMFEYAAMSFANISFASQFNPAIGKQFSDRLYAAVGQGATLAIAGGLVLAGVLSATAIPVAGWIAAGIGVIAASLMALFGAFEMVERNRKVREQIATDVQGIMQRYYGMRSIKEDFSGYQMNLIIPQLFPFDDFTDDLYQYYAMNESAWARCAPQLPFFYLNPTFDFICSLTVPAQKFLIIRPNHNPEGLIRDWSMLEIDPKDGTQIKFK